MRIKRSTKLENIRDPVNGKISEQNRNNENRKRVTEI